MARAHIGLGYHSRPEGPSDDIVRQRHVSYRSPSSLETAAAVASTESARAGSAAHRAQSSKKRRSGFSIAAMIS